MNVRHVSVWIVVCLAAVSCSSPTEQGLPEPVVSATSDPQQVARLRIALPQDFGPINLFGQHEEPLTELVYDKLLAPSPYVEQPQPWLAQQVDQVDDTTWEVTLRDDVVWHDGETFGPDDVVFTFEYFRIAPAGRWTHHVSDVPDVTATSSGPDTVRFVCAFACPALGSVTLADLPILPRHIWEGITEPREATFLPVGTGPYILTDYDATTGYTLTANAEYFAGAPLVQELIMPIIPDPATTFAALRTGELDAAARPLPPELIQNFRADPGIDVVTTAPLQFPELRLNYDSPPFDDPAVRHAVSLAIDRQALLDVALLGNGRPAIHGYPHPDSPWTNPDLSTPFDRQQAQDELEAAGYTLAAGIRQTPDGDPLTLELKVSGTEPTDVRAAQLIAEDLGRLGIAVDVVQLDAGTIGGLLASRDFDAFITTISAHGVADPDQFIQSLRSGYLWRLPETPDPELEELFDQWVAADTVESRRDISFEMQRVFNEAPTAIPLYYPDENWAFRPESYTGFVESPGYGIVHKWSFLPRDVAVAAHAIVGS
ncbi:MAG: ABC transporter substrate-binding protein [Euzebya sp.]